MAAYAADAGRRIREARERNRPDLSQEDLGHELGVTGKTVGRWERGETQPRSKQWEPLAKLLGVGVDDLRGQPPIAPEEQLRAQLDRIEHGINILLARSAVQDGQDVHGFIAAYEDGAAAISRGPSAPDEKPEATEIDSASG